MASKPDMSVGELRSRGVVKLKEDGMFALWVKVGCCNLTSEQLRKLAEITEKYARNYLLFTTRQIPMITFVNLKDVAEVQEELKKIYLVLDRCGPTVRNVNVCYSDKICPEAIVNPLSLAERLDNFWYVPVKNNKLKIGVAGCGKDCIVSRVLTDIGFVGVEKDASQRYDVFVGGRLGVKPFVGVKMAECLPEEACVRFVQNYFDLLRSESKEQERSADLINRLGLARVKQELNKNLREGLVLKPIECETRLAEKATDQIILRIRATCGEVRADQLRRIADIAARYGKGFVHFAVRGAPEIPGVDESRLESIRQELAEVGMPVLDRGIDNLQSCFGSYCTESNADPQSLLRSIEKLVEDMEFNDLSIKISAGGCPNSCAIAHLSDIGFYGVAEPEVDAANCNGCELCVPICKTEAIEVKDGVAVIDEEECRHCGQCIVVCPFNAILEKRKGFAILVGGKEGEDTRLGNLITEFLSEEEALQITERCLRILKERKGDVATIIDEVGIEKFRDILVPATQLEGKPNEQNGR